MSRGPEPVTTVGARYASPSRKIDRFPVLMRAEIHGPARSAWIVDGAVVRFA